MVKDNFIAVRSLSVGFPVGQGFFYAVDNISMALQPRIFTAIVGESGCGKSVLGQAILGILPDNVQKKGAIFYKNKPVNGLLEAGSQAFGLIPQNPSDSLNPTRKIGKQMQDILDTVDIADKNDAYKSECLEFFCLQDIPRVLAAYPHELSGGMLQRVLCAMSICHKPHWILADEPTKGLDEKVNSVVISNLQKMKQDLSVGMLIITHDIKLAQNLCDEVIVMYAGQIMERSSVLFQQPLHPYTQGFLQALPANGLQTMKGKAPAPGETGAGCKFAPRCPHCFARCLQEQPDLYTGAGGAQVRCFLYADS